MPIHKDTPTSEVIHDFVHSDNPKFDGKSKKKRIQMAIAASYAMKESVEQLDELSKETLRSYSDKAGEDSIVQLHKGKNAKSRKRAAGTDMATNKLMGKEVFPKKFINAAAGKKLYKESVENGMPNADSAKYTQVPHSEVLGNLNPVPETKTLADYVKNAPLSTEFSPLLNFLRAHKVEVQQPGPDVPENTSDMFSAGSTPTYDRAAHRQGNDQEQTQAAWDAVNPDIDEAEFEHRIQKARQKAFIAMHDLWKGERQ